MVWFSQLAPVWQGVLATLFTYAVTAMGAAMVFFFKSVNKKLMDMMMGFAAGVMIAASFWSLLSPAIELAEELGRNCWLTASIGFLLGGAFIMLSDMLLTKTGMWGADSLSRKRCAMLVTAVTLHNIPEGLAVGVAFGSAALGVEGSSLTTALMLALGIGLQNFPEGACVAMPLRGEGFSRRKSFLLGQLSGMVEPIAGAFGVVFALAMRQALPIALSFSAGAMISVVCSELIPESFKDNKNIASLGVLLGFVVMMALDVALG
ncbi:MAG: ZIP family metal transporter [Oscillospiraceae bacterium]|nr:ZIP family metal transporter [Oscillospiraceae bacterium]